MIEQINIALEQKRSGNFSAGVVKPAVRANVEKRAYTSIKSDEEWTSRSSLQTGRNHKIQQYEGIAVIELQFLLSDSDRLRVGSVTD